MTLYYTEDQIIRIHSLVVILKTNCSVFILIMVSGYIRSLFYAIKIPTTSVGT